MTKTYTHRTTSNCSWRDITADRPLMAELVKAIAKFEGVNWSQIRINPKSITDKVTGLFCDDGTLFEVDITVKYRVTK